jgi:hypothetical protein
LAGKHCMVLVLCGVLGILVLLRICRGLINDCTLNFV